MSSERRKMTTDQALDILPFWVELYERLDLEKEMPRLREEAKSSSDKVTEQQIRLSDLFFQHIFRNLPRVRDQYYAIVALVMGCTEEEVKTKPVGETRDAFLQVFNDRETIDFFMFAVKKA